MALISTVPKKTSGSKPAQQPNATSSKATNSIRPANQFTPKFSRTKSRKLSSQEARWALDSKSNNQATNSLNLQTKATFKSG
jgi:hypothetical protein